MGSPNRSNKKKTNLSIERVPHRVSKSTKTTQVQPLTLFFSGVVCRAWLETLCFLKHKHLLFKWFPAKNRSLTSFRQEVEKAVVKSGMPVVMLWVLVLADSIWDSEFESFKIFKSIPFLLSCSHLPFVDSKGCRHVKKTIPNTPEDFQSLRFSGRLGTSQLSL